MASLCGSSWSAQGEGIGSVGGGIFKPSGSDADVADTGPAIQLTASLGFWQHLGLEAEFLYVPIQLKSGVIPGGVHSTSSQIGLLAGPRFVSRRLLEGNDPAIGYLSMRAGFARIVTESDVQLHDGGWIGRAIDEIVDPGFGGFETRVTQKGFALSPKVGVMFRLTNRAAVDIAAYPLFILDRGDVTRQFYVTASFAMAAWQEL
jgi:hypothetical protein